MKREIIKRAWRIVYSNSHEIPYSTGNLNDCLSVQEKNCEWDAKRIFWRIYWITNFIS